MTLRKKFTRISTIAIASLAANMVSNMVQAQDGERKPNHLLGVQSPYLQQHVYNPVDWYPWGKEALEKAKQENKPIFLSVGYSSCHWCHVMEHESFEDEEAAKVMNGRLCLPPRAKKS